MFSSEYCEIFKSSFLWNTFCSLYFYVMIELFGRLWVQNWRVSYFLYCCFVFLHNCTVRFGSPELFRTCSYTKISRKRNFRTHFNVGSSIILIESLKTRNNCTTSHLLWKMWIWVFWMLCLTLVFLYKLPCFMAKNNPTEKQIHVEIQATLKHRPAWKLTKECKVYCYKIAKIYLNYRLQLLASEYQKWSRGSVPWKRCS